MARRRALILVEDLPVPFDRRVWTEAKTFRDAGWDVTVISPKGEGARRWHERIDGIQVFRYPLPTTAAGLANHLLEYCGRDSRDPDPGPAGAARTTVRRRACLQPARLPVSDRLALPTPRRPPSSSTSTTCRRRYMSPRVVDRGGLVHRVLLWCEADLPHGRRRDRHERAYRRFARQRGGVDPDRIFVVRSSPDPSRDPSGRARSGRSRTTVPISSRTSGRWAHRTAWTSSSPSRNGS